MPCDGDEAMQDEGRVPSVGRARRTAPIFPAPRSEMVTGPRGRIKARA